MPAPPIPVTQLRVANTLRSIVMTATHAPMIRVTRPQAAKPLR